MPSQLRSGRMAAFSDGVIAVIITVMVLELRVPAQNIPNMEGVRKVLPVFVIYVLSFVEVGIYWVNHHYMVDEVEQVSHDLLWGNLVFLFTLSLIPFGTAWVGERGLTPFGLSFYSICCALPAASWIVLSHRIRRRTGLSLGGDTTKQAISSLVYFAVIPIAYRSVGFALAMLVAVAALWLIPPKRVWQSDGVNRTSS